MSALLSNTIVAFEQWRRSKPAKNSLTPLRLRQRTVALLPHYSTSKITTGLRISGGRLNNGTLRLKRLLSQMILLNYL
jgi:hypothetical protein